MRSGARAALSSVGLILLIAGLSLAIGGFAVDALRPINAPAGNAEVVAIVGLALLVAGWSLQIAAFPTVAALGGLIIAVVAVIAADGLIVTGVIVDESEPSTFDPAIAAHICWLCAAICVAIAVALVAGWFIWHRRRGAALSVRHALGVLAIGIGAYLFISGLAAVYTLAINLAQSDGVGSSALLKALLGAGQVALDCAAGGILLWHGAGTITGVASSRFRIPPLWLPLALLAAAVAIGGLTVQSGDGYRIVPFAHAVAILAPAALLLALVSRFGRGAAANARTTWRHLLLLVAYGAAVAATIAGVINTTVLYTTFLVRLASNGAFDGVSSGSDFIDAVQNAGDYLAKSELVVILLLVIAVLAPLNEEFWKGFGVRLMRGAEPTRYQAFLFGVASGVGFGIAEAQEYGAGAFSQSPYQWWDTVLLRAGSSSLHALASGTVGVAWFYAFRGHRRRALGLYLCAVALHGSWNALNLLVAERVLPGFRSLADRNLEVVLDIVIGVLALAIIAVLCRLSAHLAATDAEPPAPHPSLGAPLDAAAAVP